jgi:hypothetical protein
VYRSSAGFQGVALVLPSKISENKVFFVMFRPALMLLMLCLLIIAAGPTTSLAQAPSAQPKSQEISDDDGIPVLIKHLPNWENVRTQAVFANKTDDLKKVLGSPLILDQLEFIPGTEAVTAKYDAGTLVIVEFSSPQLSVEADSKITQFLAASGQNSQIIYRRIGNYNAMVLDAANPGAATALLDQVKYEKNVQWLGENPFMYRRAERNFVVTTSDIFLSTVVVIVLGMGLSILGGTLGGIVFFYLREQKRSTRSQFTDAGGMTRLNLDGFTPDIAPSKLLKD